MQCVHLALERRRFAAIIDQIVSAVLALFATRLRGQDRIDLSRRQRIARDYAGPLLVFRQIDDQHTVDEVAVTCFEQQGDHQQGIGRGAAR